MGRFQALTKMCLNNWHYINEKLLTFHDEINFFTGHSGSGKSTVLDALQIVLYADSNGRGFFNKAAKEDSDRTLIEYLRGMKVVQENNEIGYLDYRTYLSFDMEQLVEGMPPMRLSKMLSKNSGGEGQNPLYVALLASFAQVYRINLKSNVRRRPTPRLVVLDEAFSKMDAEKVGSCIGLIRKLGFQAIISATNDKIQNYVDNVNKTFVFANPNKNRISVQEFEKREFAELLSTQEGDDE